MASLAVKGIMLSRQKELPKLPVPPLKETLERLWLSLQPILSEQELDASRKAIDKLGERGGEGEYLHRMLTYRYKRLDNWLDEWWLNTAYLDVRTPLPVHSSPAALFPRQTFTSEEDFLLFAAKMTAAVLEFKDLIDRQALLPDTTRHIPLDMTMYFKIFSMHRVPKPGRDELVSYLDDAHPPRHIVVMHNHHLFQVNAYNGRKPFKERDLYPLLVSVVNESRSVAPPVGVLTTENRDSWTAACQRLAADGTNARSLDAVQRSILVLCLDEAAGEKEPWEVRCPLHMLVGGGNAQCAGNRWYDKIVQIIVGAEGEAGIVMEHAPIDGTVMVPLMDYCYTYMKKTSKHKLDPPTCPDDKPLKLEFNLSEESLQDIAVAKTKMEELARDVDVIDHRFEQYGKDFVKSCQMSPDSFIQMAFQLSFFRLHGHSPATYESASTRMFLLGRTEAIRSQSKESDKFCREYLSGKLSVAELDALLRNAVGVHKDYASLAMYGQGVDRVLLGFKKVAEEMNRPLPELYKDPGYIKSITYELSTSQVSAHNEILMTFGYSVPGGYGICYSNQCNQFRFSICTRHCNKEASAVKFRDALETTLKEFGNNLIELQKAKL
ncbi:carnitine O-acetyltransferase-like isoform X2 [Dermacentor albipictus]|uniref:carnitine O-acetyltransferase-like isoform X2 n=1 Tax=Dermacentor albipictus TaxID=60249 RepID=UPI0038FC78B3